MATVTTPVVELMAKRPPALSVRLKVTAGPFGSVEEAVIPTGVPLAAASATLLAAALLSAGVEGATLPTLMVKESDELRLPSLACTVMVWLVAVS